MRRMHAAVHVAHRLRTARRPRHRTVRAERGHLHACLAHELSTRSDRRDGSHRWAIIRGHAVGVGHRGGERRREALVLRFAEQHVNAGLRGDRRDATAHSAAVDAREVALCDLHDGVYPRLEALAAPCAPLCEPRREARRVAAPALRRLHRDVMLCTVLWICMGTGGTSRRNGRDHGTKQAPGGCGRMSGMGKWVQRNLVHASGAEKGVLNCS